MTNIDIQTFSEERAEVLTSLDKNRIIEFYRRYDVEIPEDETIFWAGIHKAICALWNFRDKNITQENYRTSSEWLRKHGFSGIITH